LWMLGYPDQAVVIAEESAKRVVDRGCLHTIAYVLAACPFVHLRTGHWAMAEEQIQRLSSYCAKHRLGTYTPMVVGWLGSLAVLRGDALLGTELLQDALVALRANGYCQHRRILSGALAEGYALSGQLELAHTTVCEAIEWSEVHGPSPDLLELLRIKGEILTSMSPAQPGEGETCLFHSLQLARQQSLLSLELLRIKGEILTTMSPAQPGEGETCLFHSLQLARQQSLLSLELRAAMSLARVWAAQGRARESAALLEPIYGRFTEGFGTRDLISAGKLLGELRSQS